MTGPLQTRSVHRALDVLQFLSENGPSGLHKLHMGTGLSKSTLRRLLATLVERRFVRTGISDAMYRSNTALPDHPRAGLIVQIGQLVEVARPHMLVLTDEARWPVDLHIYVHGRMQILDSTRGLSPFPPSQMLKPETELNVFAAASGLAFLAALDDERVLAIVDELKNDMFSSLARFGIKPGRLLKDLAEIRRQGFATRRLSQSTPGDRNAIAVPLFEKQAAVGALSMSWKRKLMTPDEFAVQNLAALKHAANEISASLNTAGHHNGAG
ncbi:helix-turn-helix domain-containing protein [Roseiarcaceae bacterium H3SJ34-1]|uniref:IclR family transcriptional regulator n=1 Tax=Terripilifer ovatus TaxID=3032367 RepID=UPI003AB98928|nr:helix-turn-helix domain-containing protein [Roseiarcaceae bacterium H3SJ34-1]